MMRTRIERTNQMVGRYNPVDDIKTVIDWDTRCARWVYDDFGVGVFGQDASRSLRAVWDVAIIWHSFK
jgi:hypothetical protein